MKVSVSEFLRESGIEEPFYPGKRLVQPCRQSGEYKSHCVVFDWRDPDKIVVEVKPGLSGRTLEAEKLKNYPVSFQTPTFVEVEVLNDNEDDEDEEETKGKGKAGGGSKGQKKKKLGEMSALINKAFTDIAEGRVPDLGEVTKMVVMGMEIASEAFDSVFTAFSAQIKNAQIKTTDLLGKAGKFITKYTPPSFLAPKGNEDAVYKYDVEKNENIGYAGPSLG